MNALLTETGISAVNSIDDYAVMVYNKTEICNIRVIA